MQPETSQRWNILGLRREGRLSRHMSPICNGNAWSPRVEPQPPEAGRPTRSKSKPSASQRRRESDHEIDVPEEEVGDLDINVIKLPRDANC